MLNSSVQNPQLDEVVTTKLVVLVRGEKVLIDTDLADCYGVEVRVLNQSMARNRNRFPDDFMFQLTTDEWSAMRSQALTSSSSNTRFTSQIVMPNIRGERRTLTYSLPMICPSLYLLVLMSIILHSGGILGNMTGTVYGCLQALQNESAKFTLNKPA